MKYFLFLIPLLVIAYGFSESYSDPPPPPSTFLISLIDESNKNIEPPAFLLVTEMLNGEEISSYRLNIRNNPEETAAAWYSPSRDVNTEIHIVAGKQGYEKSDEFVTLMSRWLEFDTGPSLRRLAFGAVLLHPAENRVEGYRKIQPYLQHVTMQPEESSDFLYQINRPREAEVAISGLQINRVSKWSVGRMQLITVDAAGIQSPRH